MDLKSKDCTMDVETELNYLFSSIIENPSKTDNFKRIYWMCENNITDEVKIILLSMRSLNTFKYHLKNWNSEKPVKTIIKNLKLILFLAEKLPELKYQVLIKSRYFTEVLRIYNNCLKYLFERKQEEIDENCMLSLALSYVSKYAVKFCINDKTNLMSSFGQQFFKKLEAYCLFTIRASMLGLMELIHKSSSTLSAFAFTTALSFLRYISLQFSRNPNNCVYLLILTSTINVMMSKFSVYRSLFVQLNGIQYCLNWLSDSHKNKNKAIQTLYYDLRILSILEDFVDDPYFSANKTTIITRLIKYLQCNGERILDSTLVKESNWVFQFACSIIIKMAMTIKGFKNDICELRVKQLFMSFLNKYPNRTCAKTIYTTILVLEETNESVKDCEIMNIYTIMDNCERLSNILLLSKIYNISSNDANNCVYQEV